MKAVCERHYRAYDIREGCGDCHAEFDEAHRDDFTTMYEENCNIDADCDSSANKLADRATCPSAIGLNQPHPADCFDDDMDGPLVMDMGWYPGYLGGDGD